MYSPEKLDALNTAQKRAVLHTEGPLLIVAGAGAGKTRTIAYRTAHLLDKGVPARQVLTVTFTNKAASEMRDRIRGLLPDEKGVPLVATFHALGVRLLREFHAEGGFARDFTIWDREDSMKVLKRALQALGIEDLAPRNALAAISRAKGEGVSGSAYTARARTFREQQVARVWDAYERALSEENAFDFDDLLLRTLFLLQTSESVRTLLQKRWSHLHIDEYQDTNKVQYELARILAEPENNICVVGDGDQNIYSWRGSDMGLMLNFETEFPGAKVILLEQNYRSTRTILTAANAVIEKNAHRKPKKLFTENGTGEAIALYGARNDLDEAWFVAQTARHLIENGTKANEIAILYRENFQSRALEEAFLSLSVPYRVLGTRFFERKEIKDVLAYVRASLNARGKSDMARAASAVSRGIGKVTLEKMLAGDRDALSKAARGKVDAFQNTLTEIRYAVATLPTSEAIRFAAERSGMEKMLREDTEEGRERLENVRELVNLAVRFDGMTPPEGVERLLEEAALQSDQDELDETADAVSLMTVHASKGLEFDAVFVTGLEQGLFPAIRADDAERDPEEERRLFYVALTRARKRVLLSYAGERMRWGSREHTLPSEFLEDIDSRLLQNAEEEATESERVIE